MSTHAKSSLLVAGITTVAMAGMVATAGAQAPDTNERTKITIDAPLEIPGATLQAGSYWFELVESDANRHTVIVQNGDESKTIATLIAVPIYRQLDETKGDTELVLAGNDGAGATALDAWFFPGKQYGHQFVYSKSQARQIADRTKQVVLADDEGTVVRLNAGGISEPWAPDSNRNSNAADRDTARSGDTARTDRPAPAASTDRTSADKASENAVGTSGKAGTDSMSAEAHLDALSTMLDKALAGSGSSVTIERTTLQEMKTHLDQLKSKHDKQ